MAEKRFSKEEICQHSMALFGTYPEVVHGALANISGDSFTVEEVKRAIEKFKNKEVK